MLVTFAPNRTLLVDLRQWLLCPENRFPVENLSAEDRLLALWTSRLLSASVQP